MKTILTIITISLLTWAASANTWHIVNQGEEPVYVTKWDNTGTDGLWIKPNDSATVTSAEVGLWGDTYPANRFGILFPSIGTIYPNSSATIESGIYYAWTTATNATPVAMLTTTPLPAEQNRNRIAFSLGFLLVFGWAMVGLMYGWTLRLLGHNERAE